MGGAMDCGTHSVSGDHFEVGKRILLYRVVAHFSVVLVLYL